MIIRQWLVALCCFFVISFGACANSDEDLIRECVNTTVDDSSSRDNNYLIINSDKINCIQINEVSNKFDKFSFNYYSTSGDPGLRILLIDLTSHSVIDEIFVEKSKPHVWNNFSGELTKRTTITLVRILISENTNESVAFRNIYFYANELPFNEQTTSDTNFLAENQSFIQNKQILNYEDHSPDINIVPADIQNLEWTTPSVPPSIEGPDFTTPTIPPTDDGLQPDWTTPSIPPTDDGLQPGPDWTTPAIPPTDDGLQPGPDWTTPTIPPTDDGLQPGPDWTTPALPPTDDGLQPGPDWTTPALPPTDDGLQPGPEWTTPAIPPTDDGLQPGPDWTTPVIPPTDDGLQPGPDWTTPVIPPTDDGLQPGPEWTTPVWPPPTDLPGTPASTYDEWIIIGIIFIVLSAATMIAIIVLIITMPPAVASVASPAPIDSKFTLPRVHTAN